MTLSSTQSRVAYASGTDAGYAIPFMFLRDDDIEVHLEKADGTATMLVHGTDYQLTGAGDLSGGVCILTTPLSGGSVLFIRRVPQITQETDYIENEAFPAASHEAALDKLTMICQALSERLDRTLSLRFSSAVSGVTLPEPDANKVIGWDDSQRQLENKTITDYGQVIVPIPVSHGGTGADNPTEALMGLGFGATGMALSGCDSGDEVLSVVDPGSTLLKSDTPDLLQAAYGDEAQAFEGFAGGLEITRNHIVWTNLGQGRGFPFNMVFPYDGTYVFHIYPQGQGVYIDALYKTDGRLPDPDPNAGEIRIVVEVFNGRKTIVNLQNMEA